MGEASLALWALAAAHLPVAAQVVRQRAEAQARGRPPQGVARGEDHPAEPTEARLQAEERWKVHPAERGAQAAEELEAREVEEAADQAEEDQAAVADRQEEASREEAPPAPEARPCAA